MSTLNEYSNIEFECNFNDVKDKRVKDFAPGNVLNVYKDGMDKIIIEIEDTEAFVSMEFCERKKFWEDEVIALPLYLKIKETIIEKNLGAYCLSIENDDDYYFYDIKIISRKDTIIDMVDELLSFIKNINKQVDEKMNELKRIIGNNI